MEAIEQELEQKSVERDNVEVQITEAEPEEETPKIVKKVKKPRSAAQIAAFEKARKVRAEKIKQKKEQKVVDKVEKKALKKKVKETVEEAIKRDNDLDHGEYLPAERLVRQPSRVAHEAQPPTPSHQREQVVNNYYYYGPPQPAHQPMYTDEQEIKPKKSRRKKRPPTPSESSDEEDYDPREPLEYAEGEGPYIPPNPPAEDPPQYQQPTYKFNYA